MRPHSRRQVGGPESRKSPLPHLVELEAAPGEVERPEELQTRQPRPLRPTAPARPAPPKGPSRQTIASALVVPRLPQQPGAPGPQVVTARVWSVSGGGRGVRRPQ